MIVVTGAAGFIGSHLIEKLNSLNFNNIIAVDLFNNSIKNSNIKGLKINKKIDRDGFFQWADKYLEEIEFIFHLGARTDTTETNIKLLNELNLHYSIKIWDLCRRNQIPFIYASSAATYGNGMNGFSDDETKIPTLKPLNPYGWSKHNFDMHVIESQEKPFFWAGLKFFNVYGCNEQHKGSMASMVYQVYHQIKNTGKVRLFESNKPQEIADGEQKRDFIAVTDVVDILVWLMMHRKTSGIYNVGSGESESFNSLVKYFERAMKTKAKIEYIHMPNSIKESYQNLTKADISKLKSIGYRKKKASLEDGVKSFLAQIEDSTSHE